MIGTKILEEIQSKYNGNLRVVNTWGMGTYIQSDGLTQSGGIVENIWKQTIKKVKSEKGKVKGVLILGLGGGTVAKLIRKNWPDAKITGVDIDPIMIELGKKYLDLDESDVQVKIQDADKVPAEEFDLVIVDLYRGDKFPKKFEDEKFIKKLSKNKIVVFNRLSYKGKREGAIAFREKLKKIFTDVEEFRPITNLMFICSK